MVEDIILMMKKVIVNNIPKDIQYSLDAEYKIHPQNVQFDIIDPKDSVELAILCKELSTFDIQIDGLGGKLSSMRRQSIDISFDDAIKVLKDATSVHTSIKTYHKPFMKIRDYEKDSYFEYCTRFKWNEDDYEDVFIWIRVEIQHLEEVLTKFKNKLIYYKL